jgi:hypothetical protein
MVGIVNSRLLALALGLALVAPAADAARTTTYSGTVVAVDPQGGALMLDEVGPWRVEQGKTVVTRRTVVVSSETKVNTFIRVNVPGAFGGDFLEVALDIDDITPGDFVTAECVSERGRLVALRVTVAELS